jgi:archaellum biogenesis ATPase FlaH
VGGRRQPFDARVECRHSVGCVVAGRVGVEAAAGTGKSFLVQALGYLAIKQGFVVLYRSIFDVVRDFLRDEASRRE